MLSQSSAFSLIVFLCCWCKYLYLNPTWSFSSSPLMFWVPARILEAAFSCWTFCVLACEEKIIFFFSRKVLQTNRDAKKLSYHGDSNAERHYSVRHECHKFDFFCFKFLTFTVSNPYWSCSILQVLRLTFFYLYSPQLFFSCFSFDFKANWWPRQTRWPHGVSSAQKPDFIVQRANLVITNWAHARCELTNCT